ncbi:MAG: nucleotidyltransferase domain-containing protein [Chitinophagaceae bacterium]|nr:nucleotidyltransferase domain-containing protein [Chitinophagaceae bacterium]MDP1763274.1 nucleotidyltransferase domain-containing protein [Sediminibacterium sp.]MDP3668060.1 nucleotidyltransferase domain-containing protein [Sediminibacterium sp.]
MNQFGITDKSFHLLINTFSKYPEVEQVIIFGSRAKGNFKKGSDIDLTIKGKKCNPQTALNISAIINEELPIPYHVDIIDYDTLRHKELKEHIDRMGMLFFKRN